MKAMRGRARAARGGAAGGQSSATVYALAEWAMLAGLFDAELRAAGEDEAAEGLRRAVLALATVWPRRVDCAALAEAFAMIRAELAVRPARLH